MSELTVEKECIVCGDLIWWDDSPLPVACRSHTYGEILDALELQAERACTPVVANEKEG